MDQPPLQIDDRGAKESAVVLGKERRVMSPYNVDPQPLPMPVQCRRSYILVPMQHKYPLLVSSHHLLALRS